MLARRRIRAAWAGAALVALVVVAAAFVPSGPLGVDRSWSEAMLDIRTRSLTDIALALNWLGRFPGSLVAIGVVGAALVVARRRLALLAFVLAECLAPLVTAALKSLAGRPRPPGGLVHAGGFSFPSGHAAYAGVTCAAAVLLFAAPGARRRRWWALAAIGVAGMAWSRTYLQVHWLSDVLGGAAVGVGTALLVVGGAQRRWMQIQTAPATGRLGGRGSTSSGGSIASFGRRRSSVVGNHQVARPRISNSAGRNRQRTTTASSSTALARPRPNGLIVWSPASMKLAKTATMTAAAAVTTRALRMSPSRTASLLDAPCTQASWMRETRKIS